MSENKKPKFSRAAMLAAHAENSTALSTEKNEKAISLEIKGFSFMSADTGFLIASGKLIGEKPSNIPQEWLGRFNPDKVLVKGTSINMCDMSSVGTVFEIEGDWILDPRWGLQLAFTSVRESMPTSTEALLKYLSSGRLKGIGPATAKLVIEKWGQKTFNVLDGTLDDLSAIPGISEAKAADIKKAWATKKALYQMTAFFGMYGIGETYVPRIVESFGVDNLEARVRANPYMLTAVDGIGFVIADKMALSLGVETDSPKRITAMLSHLLREYAVKNGHTVQPVNDWILESSKILGLRPENLHESAKQLVDAGEVFVRNLPISKNGGNPVVVQCVSSKRDYKHEESIAQDIVRIKHHSVKHDDEKVIAIQSEIQNVIDILDPSQVDGVKGVLSSSISVLTGGPGTGKTTTLKNVIDIAEKIGLSVVLCAPTGRASKRMEEAIGRPASTIHRTLRYNPSQGFLNNRGNPIKADLFVVDESSMIDNSLAHSFLKAIPNGARVIFVGDIDQLPPVGPGDFLKDLIHSGAASVFRLTRIHRQAEGSHIAEAARSVLSGRPPKMGGSPAHDDFSWILPPPEVSYEDVNNFIKDATCKLVKSYIDSGFKKSDIQVISPQKDGVAGVQGMNEALRWLLNEKFSSPQPLDDDENPFPFAPGDRIMVTKNNSEKEIFNGDMAIVKSVDETVELLMEDGRTVDVERIECKSFQFGYAITVHKSQGGERPVVIMPISPSHTMSMTKNLLYTGITRGRQRVVMVGPPKTVMMALKKQSQTSRMTGLTQEIRRIKTVQNNNNKSSPGK